MTGEDWPKKVAELEEENRQLRSRIEELERNKKSGWFLVKGSNWEMARAAGSIGTEAVTQYSRTSELAIASAFRQVKYELYCASVDLLGFSLHIDGNRNCKVTPAYHLGEERPWHIKFIYDQSQRRYTDAEWSDELQPHALLYQFWVIERQCIPGFLAELFLCLFNQEGTPPLSRTLMQGR